MRNIDLDSAVNFCDAHFYVDMEKLQCNCVSCPLYDGSDNCAIFELLDIRGLEKAFDVVSNWNSENNVIN